MIIVGGTYTETCFEPIWEEVYGSGYRAVNVINQNDAEELVEFHTCADSTHIRPYLEAHAKITPRLTISYYDVPESPLFRYDHPLKIPYIFPRPDILARSYANIDVSGENILFYGMIEAEAKVNGQKVVYDPQSPVNPLSFKRTGSTAKELAIVVNLDEARIISGCVELEQIRDYFFREEQCRFLILKMGARGAVLYEEQGRISHLIPVYETDRVWSIGSGDVFSAFFALNWFKGVEPLVAATLASKATALYCNSKVLTFNKKLNTFSFPELLQKEKPKGQIYLAGPFFTFSDRWLVNEIYTAFKSVGVKIFSPFHDVGHGKACDVVEKDIEGLKNSEVIFAIVDGVDSGTLFEIGYAIAEGKKVIAFAQNETEESLKMLEGTNCEIVKDLTTAIYKTYWKLGT